MSVGDAAAGKREEIEELRAGDDELETDEGRNLLEHAFHLRKDLTVTLELPADLTQPEAERLAAFVLSLPFGRP